MSELVSSNWSLSDTKDPLRVHKSPDKYLVSDKYLSLIMLAFKLVHLYLRFNRYIDKSLAESCVRSRYATRSVVNTRNTPVSSALTFAQGILASVLHAVIRGRYTHPTIVHIHSRFSLFTSFINGTCNSNYLRCNFYKDINYPHKIRDYYRVITQ